MIRRDSRGECGVDRIPIPFIAVVHEGAQYTCMTSPLPPGASDAPAPARTTVPTTTGAMVATRSRAAACPATPAAWVCRVRMPATLLRSTPPEAALRVDGTHTPVSRLLPHDNGIRAR